MENESHLRKLTRTNPISGELREGAVGERTGEWNSFFSAHVHRIIIISCRSREEFLDEKQKHLHPQQHTSCSVFAPSSAVRGLFWASPNSPQSQRSSRRSETLSAAPRGPPHEGVQRGDRALDVRVLAPQPSKNADDCQETGLGVDGGTRTTSGRRWLATATLGGGRVHPPTLYGHLPTLLATHLPVYAPTRITTYLYPPTSTYLPVPRCGYTHRTCTYPPINHPPTHPPIHPLKPPAHPPLSRMSVKRCQQIFTVLSMFLSMTV